MTPKTVKEQIKRFDHLNPLISLKNAMYKIKRQVKNSEETLTRYVKDKGLTSLMYEEILQFKRKIQMPKGNTQRAIKGIDR